MDQMLQELEEDFWRASQDPQFYNDNVANDALFILPFGLGVMDKKTCIEMIKQNDEPWRDFKFSQLKILRPVHEIALLTYEVLAHKTNSTYKATISTTYIKQSNEWKILLHQQTN